MRRIRIDDDVYRLLNDPPAKTPPLMAKTTREALAAAGYRRDSGDPRKTWLVPCAAGVAYDLEHWLDSAAAILRTSMDAEDPKLGEICRRGRDQVRDSTQDWPSRA